MITEHKLELYDITIVVLKDCKPRAAHRLYKEKYGRSIKNTFNKHQLGCVFVAHHNLIVWVSDSTDINTVAHEAVHAAIRVLDYCGITFDAKNDEALAYLVGYISEIING